LQTHARRSRSITAELFIKVIAEASTTHGNATKAVFNQLVAYGAWTDAVLLLLKLELPQWRLRRILYEDAEGNCFFSKHPEFPLGFDESAEATQGSWRWPI